MTIRHCLLSLSLLLCAWGANAAEEVATPDTSSTTSHLSSPSNPIQPLNHGEASSHDISLLEGLIPEGTILDQYSHGAHKVVNSALTFMGVRYRFGGNSPETGFDCSGLVRRVFGDALGLQLPRSALEISQFGQEIPPANLQPGDLVFFNTLRRSFSHVGIYLGNNRFLHAPSSGGRVRVDDMNQRYWLAHFTGARRVIHKVASRLTSG